MSNLTEGFILNQRYEIHELVGEGGMSSVYRAIDLETGGVVAVKVLKNEFSYDEEFIKRFRNEASAAQKLSHPNIVAIYDMGCDDCIQYIVMEYIDGLTLDKLIKAKKKLPWRNTLKITAQILSAVEHAHSNHIIHRDIKPLNIMMTAEGTVKLTDFGIARAVSSATKSAANDSAGSVHYLSPEQVRGGFVDERTDIYSIGITMYEMITGSVPYDGDSHVSIALKHIDGKITPPHEVEPTVPYGVSDLIMLATRKETNKRFQSAGEMYECLLKVQKNPYVSFLLDYETAEEDDRPELPEESEDGNILLNEDSSDVIISDSMAEEKSAMVRNVVFQTVTYLTAVIVSVLVLIFVISRHNMVRDNFKSYNITQYKAEDYIGKPAATVKASIEACGIRVEQELEENEEYPAGYVIKQSVKTGDILRENDTVTLSVSAKAGSLIVDDYAGRSFQAVGTELKTQDINVVYKQLNSSKYDDGKIIRTSPGPGSILEKNDTITIYYSAGALYKKVTVPKLTGMTLEEARRELGRANINLNIGLIYPSPSAIIDDLLPTPTPSAVQSPALPTEAATPTEEPTATPTPDLFAETPDPTEGDSTFDPDQTPSEGDATETAPPTEEATASPTPSLPTATPTPTHQYASDRVVSQYPPAGTEIFVNETVNLYFYDINKILPTKTVKLDFPADLVQGNTCAVKIEAVMMDTNVRNILYMDQNLAPEKFPVEYRVPLSLSGAPTKVFLYVGEAGGELKLCKVFYIHE